MFKIIAIKPNDFNLDNIPYKSTPNQIYKNISRDDIFKIKSNYIDFPKLKSQISSFIEVIEVNNESFMKESVQLIDLDDKHFGDVRDSYEDPNNLYQIMFKSISQYDTSKDLKSNVLGSLITNEKELIYGSVVLFKTNLPKENFDMKNISVEVDDLINLIMNNIYHTGVYIDEENRINQIFFNNEHKFVDPLLNFNICNKHEQIMKSEQYGFRNNEVLKYSLQFIFDMNSHNNINEPMSRIMCAPIRGKGVIISPCENDNSFYDISKDDIINLLKLSPNYQLKTSELLDEKNIEGLKLIKNKYRILQLRLKEN